MRIALTGNPNSGKTTMYNALTGQSEKVGNWAGVTVERKEHAIRKAYAGEQEGLIAVDLPGAYSMSPFTSEESVTSEYVRNEQPDVIVNIVDATNLSRSLFFTTQLLELGIPMVVALNKADVNEKKHTTIDKAALSAALGCPVIDTVSTTNEGLAEVIKTAVAQVGKQQKAPYTQTGVDLSSKAEVEKADRARFAFVNGVVRQVEKRVVKTADKNVQDKIDAVVTHPVLGLAIFAAVMYFVFWFSQASFGPWLADTFTAWLESFQGWVAGLVTGASDILQTLLVDGVIGGVIAVVGFLPLVMVMYFLIALLEDCGYMARASVVLDPIFKKVGLSGKSVIPFVITTGCAIPGVMACRTIRNERERRATAMLAPFMPCGAKLPVIALFAGAFFSDAPWVSPLMYFAGILLIFLGALLVNLITGHQVRKSYFIIELPEYKVPSLQRACQSMISRGWAYIVKAGTIILLCNTVVQVMQMFTWSLRLAETADASILATIANPFAYVLIPIVGFHAWQLAAAAVTGFIAKENVVGTVAVCYGISSLINTEELALEAGAGTEVAAILGLTKAAALAYLMFNLFTPPCFAAIGAMNSEMKSAKWLWGGIGLQLSVGFTVGYLVYQIGTLITTGAFGAGFIPGLAAVIAIAAVITGIILNTNKRLKAEAAAKA
ncbi:MAG: ferrous iron transport protein B [Clostridia bacterium]|nr:ferrous iron transport protein B [Clostridia bacterium]